MANVEKSIEVNVPVHSAYNQWTQFETFPQFMEGVEEVRQEDDTRLHWTAKVMGKKEEWNAKITEQVPDRKIAWQSTSGAPNAGEVTFQPLSDTTTRVNLRLEAEPRTVGEKVGDAIGVLDRQVKTDLDKFKHFIESRGGQPTGEWRGEVKRGEPS
ncbi:MAG TPA: SRPBCC family protein [Candidatus Dormibacteraeota bacterium]|nr:SRPBCC family protein [Candidatus Dormibacteraeota bacterium]